MRIPKENLEMIKTTIFEAIESGRMPAYRGNSCLYRDGEGHACAYGVLVPDDHPHLQEMVTLGTSVKGLEGSLGEAVFDVPALHGAKRDINTLDFLSALQHTHDSIVGQYYETHTREEMKGPLREAYESFFEREEAYE